MLRDVRIVQFPSQIPSRRRSNERAAALCNDQSLDDSPDGWSLHERSGGAIQLVSLWKKSKGQYDGEETASPGKGDSLLRRIQTGRNEEATKWPGEDGRLNSQDYQGGPLRGEA